MNKAIALLFSMALLQGGCSYSEGDLDPTLKGFFGDESGDARPPARFTDVQAASGARADAMLHGLHFDGTRLNSLGEAKLSLMLADDDAADPLKVFVAMDESDDRWPARRAAVVRFVRDLGLGQDQVEVVAGENPRARTPAAWHLSRQDRAESPATGGSAGADSGAGGEMGHEPGGGFLSQQGGMSGGTH